MSQNTDAGVRPSRVATLRQDFLASIVVFLVALPLCMGIAIASGAPPAAGLISGIVGGIVVGTLAGSPLQVSGPAAGLTVVVLAIVQQFGLAGMGIIVLGAGFLQLLAGVFRLGQWFRAVPPAVIHGMLAGIGILIFASQFHVMVDDSPRGSPVQNLLSIPESIMRVFVPEDGKTYHIAGMIGGLTLLIIIAWQILTPKKLRVIPGALVAIVVATVVAEMAGLSIKRVTIPGNMLDALLFPTAESLRLLLDPAVVGSVLAVAAIASAETLLCASAVDGMHSGPRTKYDRELMAQGIGNMLCGSVSALPMTGVIVRSGANVQAGARTRLSAILHGVWLLGAVFLFTNLLSRVPTASLAALLVYTGYKLVNIKHIKALAKYGWTEVAIYAATVITIVSTDLLKGVIFGVILAAVKLLYRFSHVDIRMQETGEGLTIFHLKGCCTFLGLPKLAAALERVPANTALHVHLEDLDYIDHACLDLLMNWEKQHEATGGSLTLDWGELHARFWGGNGKVPAGQLSPSRVEGADAPQMSRT
jgi:MFS superfamily sulfate permease-like transporter